MGLIALVLGILGCTGDSTPEEPPDPAVMVPSAAETTVPDNDRYAARHVLITHAGATRAPSGISRTEPEAHQRAVDVWRRAQAGESLEELALRYSDGPSAPRSGRIGVYRVGTMAEPFEQAIAAVEVGELTEPFQTAFGWHVAQREPIVEAEARHVLVTWRGAVRSRSTRSKAQARARIGEAQSRLEAGEEFATVASDMSEDVSAPRGGNLGLLSPGQLIPSFDEVLFSLEPGSRSGIVETPYGFHIVERIR